jgi:hypothetical protein
MSEENVEIVRRYYEEQASEALPLEQLPTWAAGFWESDGDYSRSPAAARAVRQSAPGNEKGRRGGPSIQTDSLGGRVVPTCRVRRA